MCVEPVAMKFKLEVNVNYNRTVEALQHNVQLFGRLDFEKIANFFKQFCGVAYEVGGLLSSQ
ncbi:hypothetical protein DRP04_11450 [Archaeoglobales archaeon]|nr:MAG: hypothetical protein DRP04_11450 [Archaeoglobales archaeon]